MKRPIYAYSLLAVLAPAAAAQGPSVSADEMVELFGDVCLGALPDFADTATRLDDRGFGDPDAAGFRLHELQPLAAMASGAELAGPEAPPSCMVMGARTSFDEARERLEGALDGRGSDLRALHSTSVDVDHRIWLWREDGRQMQLVLAEDGRGNLTAVVSVLPEEPG